MASLSKTAGGFVVQFRNRANKRPKVRLGNVSRQTAEQVRGWIERINALQLAGLPLDEESARWLGSLADQLHARVAQAGLTVKRSSSLLGTFLAQYTTDRQESVKGDTFTAWGYTVANLTECYGADTVIREITDGDKLRRWMKAQGLAENTIRRRCGLARQFFAHAVKERHTERNPFADLPTKVQGGSREFYVTGEMAQAVLNSCPDLNWRLYFGLARIGGFRCPSETRRLTWADIDWDRQRIRITSPKTEAHEGHDQRWIPLFKSLRPLLDEAWEAAQPGDTLILPRRFEPSKLKQIIRKAGLKPWPKLLMNLRASRQTELLHQFPSHVVCAWMGHSGQVAGEHYSQIRDEDFAAGLDG